MNGKRLRFQVCTVFIDVLARSKQWRKDSKTILFGIIFLVEIDGAK